MNRPSQSKVIYKMPSNAHGDGIIKQYARIEVECNKDLVGSLSMGFLKNHAVLGIQDVVELDNLITILKQARDGLKFAGIGDLEYGETVEVGIFNHSIRKEKYE